jgi:hypothetical protein
MGGQHGISGRYVEPSTPVVIIGYVRTVVLPPVPDCRCNYKESPPYNDKRCLVRLDGAFYIWYQGPTYGYLLSPAPGIEDPCWISSDPEILDGMGFSPAGSAEGYPQFFFGSH